MRRLFCFGLGYSALALARHLSTRGWHVAGTATTDEGLSRIADLGFEAYRFDGSASGPGIAEALLQSSHVLSSVPPDAAGDPVLRFHREDLRGAPHLSWIGYLSTVGVYGDWSGAWVDEETEPRPSTERARRRVAAEEDWLSLPPSDELRVVVFRLSGIYGPGRSAVDTIRNGTAQRIVKPGQVFNRIHVDDIAAALARSADGAGTHRIYNLTDDLPAPPQDVVACAARLLGLPLPPEVSLDQASLSPMGRSFYDDNRRVSNARIKRDLGLELRYPTYREGLAAIVSEKA